MKCKECHSECIHKGKSRKGIQRYFCKSCKCYKQVLYVYQSYKVSDHQIKQYVKEGLGIRSMARLLKISPTTVLRRILRISMQIKPPMIGMGKDYEMDEMRTYIGNKTRLFWIAYGLDRATRDVVSFNIGKRSNKTLRVVSETLILSNPGKIYTDKLINYRGLIPPEIHSTKQYSINHIERMNLTLRTHLKRLNRRTICYSKSLPMLSACLKIYFWG